MGQKVNPRGFRIGITQNHRSTWFANSDGYKKHLEQEHRLRQDIVRVFPEAQISKMVFELKETPQGQTKSQLIIHTPKPRTFLGTGGSEKLDTLRKSWEKKFDTLLGISMVEMDPVETSQDSKLIAESIGAKLEDRENFRRAMKQAISNASNANVEGIKIQISGRLNGAEMARCEWIREGRVPLHTLKANIDYYSHAAQTKYGLLGIKVWVFQSAI